MIHHMDLQMLYFFNSYGKFNGETSYEEYRREILTSIHTDATKFTKEEVIKSFL